MCAGSAQVTLVELRKSCYPGCRSSDLHFVSHISSRYEPPSVRFWLSGGFGLFGGFLGFGGLWFASLFWLISSLPTFSNSSMVTCASRHT